MSKKDYPNQMVRYDRNLANNILDINRTFGEYSNIVKDLIVYLSIKSQNQNLFNEIEIDPLEFGQMFSYSTNYLKANSEAGEKEIGKIMVLNQDRKREMKTRLEHALFLLGSKNIVFSNKTFNTSTGEETETIDFIQIITSLKIMIAQTDVRMTGDENSKRKYLIKLNEHTINAFLKWYVTLDTSILHKLRKPGIYDLYIYLKNVKQLNKKKNALNFDYLTSICKISPTAKDRYKKRKIAEKIEKLKDIQKDLLFEFKWEKQTSKSNYNYSPVIYWEENPLDKELQKTNQITNKRFFNQRFISELEKAFKKESPKEDFKAWIKSNAQKEKVQKIYKTTYCLMFSEKSFTQYKMVNHISSLFENI